LPNKKGLIYEVWITQGQGGGKVAEFPTRKQALAYIKEHKGEGSFAVKLPSGKWYDWSKGKAKRPVPNHIPHTPWFIRERPKNDGLAVIENGTHEGNHIAECEWHIAEFIVQTVNKAYKGD
jgi:hypothetical protein